MPDPTEQYLDNLAWNSSAVTRDDEFDPLTLVAAQVTLEEKLLHDLGAMIDPEDMPIAEYLVGSLDSDGYLRCSTYEVCQKFDVEPEKVEEIIRALQSLEPPGIGARDVRECMLIQLRYLELQGIAHPLAMRLVEDFLEELGKHKFNRIAQQLGVSPDRLRAVLRQVIPTLPADPPRIDDVINRVAQNLGVSPDRVRAAFTQTGPNGMQGFGIPVPGPAGGGTAGGFFIQFTGPARR
jgi:RNA polymerase sigma-54 factor